jgi:hypothetical protein
VNHFLWPIVNWLTAALGSTVFLGAIVFLFRGAIVEWIRRSIQHVYDERLETLRAANEREVNRLRSALDGQQQLVSAAFLEARRASNERRLDAIQTIWDAMMQIYFNAPGVVSMTNIVTTELYAEMLSHMRPNIPDLLTMAQQLVGLFGCDRDAN